MKKIQPYWYLLTAILLLALTIYKTDITKSKIIDIEKANTRLESLGKYIHSLEKYYANPNKNYNKLISLLKKIERKNIKIDKNIKKSKARFKVEGIDKNGLDILVRGILNSTMRIKRINIDRSDKNNTRIEVEVLF
ncbi:MAG TPA: hypothetical protein EYG74_05410 [Sulfurimonas autotrophica]|nr:hypothetical protein [Sulfurimonas autotrophica]